MPINPLPIIEQYESGGKNIKQGVVDSSISTASGYFQITNSTHNSVVVPATGLPKVGPGTNFPNGVMDLSRSQQEQAAKALFEKNGFSDWTCTGCNGKLADYVKSQGGAAAFDLNGDNPLTASDTAGDGSSGLPAVSFNADNSSSSSAMPAVSDTPGPLSKPFTWLYKETISGTRQIIDDDISAMQTAVGSYADGLITLALICLGIRCLLGRYVLDQYARFVLTVCFVVPFIAVGSSLYQSYVVDPVLGLPSWWQQNLAMQNGIELSGSNPASMLDAVYNQVYHVITEIWKATPLSFGMFWNGAALCAAWVIVAFSLLAVFMAYAIITLLAMILLVIGPVMIPMVLFRFTSPLFHGWIRATITLVLSMLAIDVLLAIFLSVMTNLMSALTITGTPDTDLPSVWGCALAMAVLGWSVKYVPSLISMIGGGVAVSLDGVSRHMSGAAAASVAMTPVNAARRYIGMR